LGNAGERKVLITISLDRRGDAITRLLKIQLRNYPEHVVAQAIRKAHQMLTSDPNPAL